MTINIVHLSGSAQVEGELNKTFDQVLNDFIIENNIKREDIISVIADSIEDGMLSYFEPEWSE